MLLSLLVFANMFNGNRLFVNDSSSQIRQRGQDSYVLVSLLNMRIETLFEGTWKLKTLDRINRDSGKKPIKLYRRQQIQGFRKQILFTASFNP